MAPARTRAMSHGARERSWWMITSSMTTFSITGVRAVTTIPKMDTPEAMPTLALWAARNGSRRRTQPPFPGGAGWMVRTGGSAATADRLTGDSSVPAHPARAVHAVHAVPAVHA